MTFTLSWGILATGQIATLFSKDLLISPCTRSVSDVTHKIHAVASSSSVERAQAFIDAITTENTDEKTRSRTEDVEVKRAEIKAYGSYEELVSDPGVQAIYVATPHSFHYEHALLALRAHKHVLCEKPFTINARQSKHLMSVAKANGVFLMEAMWTRFFPLVRELERMLHEEKVLGRIINVHADFGLEFPGIGDDHRLLNPMLGGGALLDLGIYALTWALLAAHRAPENLDEDGRPQKPRVTASMLKARTGVDAHTTIALDYEKSEIAALVTTNMRVRSLPESTARISGEKGYITIGWAPFRPESFTLHLLAPPATTGASGHQYVGTEYLSPKKIEFEIPGHGMFWEADEVARCVRDGKGQSTVMGWEETVMVMEIMDEARRQGHFQYPEELEAVEEGCGV
ncbi:hypothetical protein YB2330_001263 [Saitoella coloradoensis]